MTNEEHGRMAFILGNHYAELVEKIRRNIQQKKYMVLSVSELRQTDGLNIYLDETIYIEPRCFTEDGIQGEVIGSLLPLINATIKYEDLPFAYLQVVNFAITDYDLEKEELIKKIVELVDFAGGEFYMTQLRQMKNASLKETIELLKKKTLKKNLVI